LDIFGFESLKHNSFEQLCINYCNETLQQKFCQDVFKKVAKTYEEEGIKLPAVEFTDNAAVLKVIEGRMGLFDLLNEEGVRPGGNNKSFTSKAINVLAKTGDSCLQRSCVSSSRKSKKNSRLRIASRVSPGNQKRGSMEGSEPSLLSVKTGDRKGRVSLAGDGNGGVETESNWAAESDNQDYLFTIKHYAATVLYCTRDWCEKNKDALHDDMISVLMKSKSDFVVSICTQKAEMVSEFRDSPLGTRVGTALDRIALNAHELGQPSTALHLLHTS
jgi:myosin heavy subunit